MRKRLDTKLRFALTTILGVALILGIQLEALHAETTLFQRCQKKTFAKLGKISKPNKPMRIGVVLVTLSNPFWVSVKYGFEQAAKDFGAKIDIQAAPQENSVTAQLDILENMVAKGYDAIVAFTITDQNLIPGLAKANKKGIVVITDKRVDMKAAREAGANPIYLGLVDYYAQGKIGAKYIAKKLKKEGGGKVAIIEGLPGAPQSEARRDGARDVFNADQSLKLVSVQPGNWDRMTAYNITTNLLQANPDLKGIICANDIMALAAVEAIEAAGKKGRVTVVGIDLIPEAKEAIAKGQLAGSVAFSPFVIGELCTRTAVAAVMGKKIPKDLYVASVLATKSNINLLYDWK